MSLLLLLPSEIVSPARTGPTMITGGTVVTGTGVRTGQGNNPLAWVLYSTSNADVNTPVWQDATAKLRSFTVSRGRQSELSDVDPGQATITLDNLDRGLDPTSNAGLRPMNRWWIREQFSSETQDLFNGYATRYDLDYPHSGYDATSTVSCADEFMPLNLRRLPVTDPPRDTYGDVVQFDSPTGYWQFTDAAALNHSLQPTVGSMALTGGSTAGGGAAYTSDTAAIVGDNGWALKHLGGGSTTNFQSAPMNTGDPGDFTGLVEMTVEFWFKTANAAPASIIAMVTGPLSGAVATFDISLLTTGVIQGNVRMNAGATTYTVNAPSAIVANTWYHVVLTVRAGNLYLYLNGTQVASTAVTGAFGATLAAGAVLALQRPSLVISVWYDEFAVYPFALPVARINAHYIAGTQRGFPYNDGPAARFGGILDSITSHAPRRVSSGNSRTMLGAYMQGQPALDELRTIRQAQNVDCNLFAARDGTIVLLLDGHRSSSPYNTVQATYGDGGGAELPYLDITLIPVDDSLLANEWNVSSAGQANGPAGFLQTTSDTTSISRYLKRPQSLTGLSLTLDSDASAIATAMLAKYKDPLTRITSVTPNLADPNTALATFKRDLGDKVTVIRRPPGGGSTISQDLFIESIQIQANRSSPVWSVQLGVTPV